MQFELWTVDDRNMATSILNKPCSLKFARRFGAVEGKLAAAGKTPPQSDLAEMDALWDEAKREELE